MHRTILVQSYLKGEKLEWVFLQKLQSLMLILYILYLHRTVLLSTMQKLQSKYSRWEKDYVGSFLNNAGAHSYRRSLWGATF